jgi:hypothetical protein
LYVVIFKFSGSNREDRRFWTERSTARFILPCQMHHYN